MPIFAFTVHSTIFCLHLEDSKALFIWFEAIPPLKTPSKPWAFLTQKMDEDSEWVGAQSGEN